MWGEDNNERFCVLLLWWACVLMLAEPGKENYSDISKSMLNTGQSSLEVKVDLC